MGNNIQKNDYKPLLNLDNINADELIDYYITLDELFPTKTKYLTEDIYDYTYKLSHINFDDNPRKYLETCAFISANAWIVSDRFKQIDIEKSKKYSDISKEYKDLIVSLCK